MFKQRLFTAVIMAVLFLTLLLTLSAQAFSLLIMLLVILAGWEWTNLANIHTTAGKLLYLTLLCLLLAVVGYGLNLYGSFNQQLGYQISLIAVGLWAVIFLWVQGYPSSAILWSPKPILQLLGLLLLTFTWVAAVTILHSEDGQWLLLFAVLIVILADIGGYVFGNLFGRHKLAPVISPGKTWEGFIGALVTQLILIAVLRLFLPDYVTLSNLFMLVIPVALYSVLGDLFESMIKRHSGVKDSSQLLPGHGGVLDRIDGMMAALPLFSLLLTQTKPL